MSNDIIKPLMAIRDGFAEAQTVDPFGEKIEVTCELRDEIVEQLGNIIEILEQRR